MPLLIHFVIHDHVTCLFVQEAWYNLTYLISHFIIISRNEICRGNYFCCTINTVTLGRCINAITESLSNIDIEYKLHVNNLLKQKGKVQKNYTFNKGSRL